MLAGKFDKTPSLIRILGFVDGHTKRAIVAREVNFGAAVGKNAKTRQ